MEDSPIHIRAVAWFHQSSKMFCLEKDSPSKEVVCILPDCSRLPGLYGGQPIDLREKLWEGSVDIGGVVPSERKGRADALLQLPTSRCWLGPATELEKYKSHKV